MIRTLLTTTAFAALLSTGAYAQETQNQTQQPQMEQQNQATQPGRLINRESRYERNITEQGYFTAGQGEILASSLIGKGVYGSAGDDAERIGDVNDVVIAPNGSAEAVIIGVGGFLGIGEKDVAVDFSQVSWVDRDGERWFVVEATKEELEAAPSFDRSVTEPATAQNQGVQTQQQTVASETATGQATTQNQNVAVDQPATQNQAAGAMPDRNAMQPLDMATMRAENLQGKRVYGANNEDIGEISDVLLTQDGQIDAFVVDVGGFLGIGEKEVAIAMQNIDFMQDADGNIAVFTPFTQAQLEQQSQYSQEGYQTDRNNTVLMAP